MTEPSRQRAVSAPRGSIRVARILGVPVYLSASWLFILVFITVTFTGLFDSQVADTNAGESLLLAGVFALLSAICVLAHEFGHVVVALRLGLSVRQVYLFLLGGISEISPDPRTPGQEFAVSAAGPAASASIAGLAWVAMQASTAHSAVEVELQLLVWSNLVIAVFNALPGLPLDGGRVLRALVWAGTRSRVTGTVAGAWGGRAVAIAVVVAAFLMPRDRWSLAEIGVTVALAAFLWLGANQNLVTARLGERVPSLTVAALLRCAVWLPADTPLTVALQAVKTANARSIVVVDSADRPIAVVNETRVASVAPADRAWTTVAEVATTVALEHALPISLTGRDLLATCRANPATEYLVLDVDGLPIGVLVAADIRGALTATASTT